MQWDTKGSTSPAGAVRRGRGLSSGQVAAGKLENTAEATEMLNASEWNAFSSFDFYWITIHFLLYFGK